jgi:hypothetical protein
MKGPWRRVVDCLTALILFAFAVPCLTFGIEKARGILSFWGPESVRELREGDPEAYFWILVAGIPLLTGTAFISLALWLVWRARLRVAPFERHP